MLNPPRQQYSPQGLRDAVGDFWQGVQARQAADVRWREAGMAESEACLHDLIAAEQRLNALIREAREAGVVAEAEPEDDDRWLRLVDGVGRAITWLLMLLVPVAVVGWWVTW